MNPLKQICSWILKKEVKEYKETILSLTNRIENRDKALKEISQRLQHREVKLDLYKTLEEKEVLVDDLQVIQRLHIIYANLLPRNEKTFEQSQQVLENMIMRGTDLPEDHNFVKNNEELIIEQRWIVETTGRIINKLKGIL